MKDLIYIILIYITLVKSCCNDQIPWSVCKYIPLEDEYKSLDCEDDESRTGISCNIREHFMNLTLALRVSSNTPCPFNVFTAMLVHHRIPYSIENTDILCSAVNLRAQRGRTAHAEMELLRDCYQKFLNESGLGQVDNRSFWQPFTLYGTGEPCTMCASAIRFQGVGEIVYAVPDNELDDVGLRQISVTSEEVKSASNKCNFGGDGTAMQMRTVKLVLHDTILPYFSWQFNPNNPCPNGCQRVNNTCLKV